MIKGARVKVIEGIMKRAGDKSFQPRGRRITSAREREVQNIKRMARKEEEEKRRSHMRTKE